MQISKSNFSTSNIFCILFFLIASGALLQSCGDEKKPIIISQEKMRQESGTSVRTMPVATQEFIIYQNFITTLEGIRQETISSMVNDKIDKFPFKIGSNLKEGQLVIQFPTANPALQYEQTKINFENLKKKFDKSSSQLAAGEITRQNYENLETQYLVAKKNYDALQQMLFVTSPIDGQIVEKFVNAGIKVKIGDKLFTVAQTEILKCTFWMTDSLLINIKKGMEIQFQLNEKEYKGQLTDIAQNPDPVRKAYKVEAEFPNPKNQLKVAQTIEIKFEIYKNPNAILIPISAVVQKDGKSYVFIAIGDNSIRKEITPGKSQDEMIEILSGLNPGDNLIYEGVSLLRDNGKIIIE